MRRARGFSLIEVLVAFVVLAGGLGVLIAILSGGMNQVRWAQGQSEAVQVARSALDTLGTVDPITPGRSSGEAVDGRYRWELLVEPFEDSEVAIGAFDDPQAAVQASVVYRIDLELRWDGGGPRERLHMSTLRSVNAPMDDDGVRDWVP